MTLPGNSYRPAPRTLSESQVRRARELWRTGRTLEDIAREVGCGLFDLSPWLYTEDWNADTPLRSFSNSERTRF